MILIKSEKEIKIMREAGRILAGVMVEVIKAAKPDVKTKELDFLAERLIKKSGAKSSFKMVDRYLWASCININNGLVHGIPNDYQIQPGDVVTIDLGVFYQGFHSDMARTFLVSHAAAEVERFLKTGRLALKKATAMAQPGNYVGHISQTIQKTIEKNGYNVSRKFTGHGIGKKLHEDPRIFCFLEEKVVATPKLKPGMVLAIEAIYAQGEPEVKIASDNWTAETIDGKLGALFENTVAITEAGPRVLTMVE